MIFFLTAGILFAVYATLILYYTIRWQAVPVFKTDAAVNPVRVSVIIPARNEEKALPALLQSLSRQDYPAADLEIIVVDDHSTDNTAVVVKSFPQVKLISLTEDGINSYKKKAVETGIAAATGEWIVCTDADCVVPEKWVSRFMQFARENQSVFIAAPVKMAKKNGLVALFQSMDFRILQGITAVSVHDRLYAMCNGANIAYRKSVFEEVEGFKEVDHLASGDDMFLMEKIRKKYPQQVHYLKSPDAIVETEPMHNWLSFFRQRIRWASKSFYYKSFLLTLILIWVYLLNLLFPAMLIAAIWKPVYLYYTAVAWVLKTVIEIPFYISVSRFFGNSGNPLTFFFMQPLHVFYTCVSGMFSQIGSYEWKGRKVK